MADDCTECWHDMALIMARRAMLRKGSDMAGRPYTLSRLVQTIDVASGRSAEASAKPERLPRTIAQSTHSATTG